MCVNRSAWLVDRYCYTPVSSVVVDEPLVGMFEAFIVVLLLVYRAIGSATTGMLLRFTLLIQIRH